MGNEFYNFQSSRERWEITKDLYDAEFCDAREAEPASNYIDIGVDAIA